MDRGAWWATVHGVTKSRAQLSNLTYYVPGIILAADAFMVHLWFVSSKGNRQGQNNLG